MVQYKKDWDLLTSGTGSAGCAASSAKVFHPATCNAMVTEPSTHWTLGFVIRAGMTGNTRGGDTGLAF